MSLGMSLPSFYDPVNAESWSYRADINRIRKEAEFWRSEYGISPSVEDRCRVELVIIDTQKDFCFPEGTLFVSGRSGRGAVEDNDRITRFIYHNLPYFTNITATLDSHYPLQIFFDSFWLQNQNRPAPFTTITLSEFQQGLFEIDPAVFTLHPRNLKDDVKQWIQKQVAYYLERLEAGGKYHLTIWPYHALVGQEGHKLVGVIEEATQFHSMVRQVSPTFEMKGESPWSEHYSAFGAEVRGQWDTLEPVLHKNHNLIDRLVRSDAVIFVGQASSHCLKASVDDYLSEVSMSNPGAIGRVYVVKDCTSAVCIFDDSGKPLIDFTESAENSFVEWESKGVHIVSSDVSISRWPNFDHLLRA